MFIRKSAEVFIYFSPSHVRILLEFGALSIKCMVKHCVFRKRAAALFALKDNKVIRGGAAALIFVRLILRAAFFSSIYIYILLHLFPNGALRRS